MSVMLFGYSLVHTAYIVEFEQEPLSIPAVEALLFGWYDLFGAGISWIANFFLIYSYSILFKNTRLALAGASVAVSFALSFLFFDEVMINRYGVLCPVLQYGPGFWLWVGSALAITFGSFAILMIGKYGTLARPE